MVWAGAGGVGAPGSPVLAFTLMRHVVVFVVVYNFVSMVVWIAFSVRRVGFNIAIESVTFGGNKLTSV